MDASFPSSLAARRRLWLALAVLAAAALSCQFLSALDASPTPPTPAVTATVERIATLPVSPTLPVIESPGPSVLMATLTPAQPVPTTTHSLPASPTTSATAIPAASATPALPLPSTAPAQSPPRALDAAGPWLLIHTDGGLWAANEDGTGLTPLTATPLLGPRDLDRAISPDGKTVAFITGDEDGIHNLTLNLLTLPTGRAEVLTALTNRQSEPGRNAMPGDPAFEGARAIVDVDSLAWSPDGRTLAFIGMLNGLSADLYVYSQTTRRITRLSDGPAQAYAPAWSPDGRYIVHFGVETFGTGAGYSMSGAWAARADNTGMIDLYRPDSSGEDLVGWLNGSQFLVSSWSPVCGRRNLRVVTIGGRAAQNVVAGCFSGAAMTPWGQTLVAGDTYSDLPGVNLFLMDGGQREEITAEEGYEVSTLSDGVDFLVSHPGRMAVYGANGDLLAESPPEGCGPGFGVAGYGLIYAWACAGDTPGVWINGPGLGINRVFSGPAEHPAFGLENDLLFFSQGRLYFAPFLDYTPVEMAAISGTAEGTVSVLDVAWARQR